MSRADRTSSQVSGLGAAPETAATGALQSALAAEQAAVYGYGVVGAYLTGPMQSAAGADWLAHTDASNTIEAMLRASGRSRPPLPPPTSCRFRCRTRRRPFRSLSSSRTGSGSHGPT